MGASEIVQDSEGKMEMTQWKKEMVRDNWDENEDKRKFQEQETPSETARLTLSNGSTWSTEKNSMRRYNGTFDILFTG